MYQLILDDNGTTFGIKRLSDNAGIPLNDSNRDYQEYLKWLDGYELVDGQWTKTSNGNSPEPADE